MSEADETTDNAISQLYQSIAKLDPLNDEIDAKIIAKVTNGVRRKKDKDGCTQALSAQQVRQDMKILKKIRASKRGKDEFDFATGNRFSSQVSRP